MNSIFNYLKLPNEVKIEENSDTHAIFSFEPLNEGYAITIGNALRRVLLSSIPGIAIVGIEIEGVEHEFSSIDGIKEDVMNIILNLKQVVFKALNDNFESATVYLKKSDKGNLTAADLEIPGNIEIVNKDVYITQLMDNASINASIYLEKGVGYKQTSDIAMQDRASIGYIPVDALFSPVKRVTYKTLKSTMKDYYDYEKLLLEIETNGSVTAKDALNMSSYILNTYLSMFSDNFKEASIEIKQDKEEEKETLNENLLKSVDELELNVRSSNCLSSQGIKYIWQLVSKTDSELLSTKNFGKQSLKEIKESLGQLELGLGMELSEDEISKIKNAIAENEKNEDIEKDKEWE